MLPAQQQRVGAARGNRRGSTDQDAALRTTEQLVAREARHVCAGAQAVGDARFVDEAGLNEQARAWVQISPDGMRWVDEGSMLPIPRVDDISSVRVRNFGTYLRVMTVLPEGSSFKALLTLSLKE